MKRVGMITFYRKNYGAFLQAYALQKTLIKQGYMSEIIHYDYCKDHTVLGVPMAFIKRPKHFLMSLAVEVIKWKPHRDREKVFEKSIQEYIGVSKNYYKDYRELEAYPPDYDVYLTGSDQVFNSDLSPQAFRARMLCFVRNGKRVSYAASAGGSCLKEQDKHLCISELRKFDSISVRESGLKQYLIEEYGIDAQQHIDPTFLLTKEDWEDFAKCDASMAGKYIFYYRVLQQPELRKTADEVSKILGLPVFVADGNDRFENQMPRTHFLSPEEWVGMMNNAAYVVTNSFHGTAFSINLGKRASIVIPPQGGERIRSLLEKCNLLDMLDETVMLEDTDRIYAEANNYLSQERNRANSYLQSL